MYSLALAMPPKRKPVKRDTAEISTFRMHDGDKAFITLAVIETNAPTFSGYIIKAALDKAAFDLKEKYDVLKRKEYVEREAELIKEHPENPIFRQRRIKS